MKSIYTLLLALMWLLVASCSDSNDEPIPDPEPEPEKPKTELTITAPENVTVSRRANTTVNVSFSGNFEGTPRWECTSSNPAIATATKLSESSMSVSGVSAGQADVKIECSVNEEKFSKTIKVTVEQGVVKILAIGNSFSQDAVEQYLYELADAAGIKVVIGNMYIGGCDLDKHLANMQGDLAAYDYRKVENGKKTSKASMKISTVLADEPWDYISLQQASGKSGKYETYTALTELISRISATVPEAKLMWHQTWAYASSSTHSDFPAYGSDQMTMYNAIVSSARRAMNDHAELKLLIPSGTAIQNARTAYVGDVFNRDGYHLEVTYGRYTAACTWFESLFGIDVTTTTYAPETVSAEMAAIARAAAHAAVSKPDAVTVLTQYATPDIKEGDLTAPVYIDFGPNSPSSSPWNNITSYEASSKASWLRDTNGDFVSVNLKVLGGFTAAYPGVSGENNQSPITVGGVEFPIAAWKDGLLVSGTKGQGNVGPGRIEIAGLTPGSSYNFTILAVRFNGSRDARITSYVLKGATESDVKQIKTGLKIGSGSGTFPNFASVPFDEYTATFTGVKPSSSGTVTIEVTGIDTGVAADGHINALVIAPAR